MESSTIIVILGLFVMTLLLIFDKMRPGFTLFAGAIVFMALGIISPEELLKGFSNKEMMTVAMLFLIGEGVQQSGAMDYAARRILPLKRRKRIGGLLARILPPITAISMFLNNTAVVIIFAPLIKRWATKLGLPITKFMIPLSYATIFGGMCTLIGTSTNMVVNGLMINAGYNGFSMFELGKVGFVIAVVGTIYLILFGKMLLPDTPSEEMERDKGYVSIILTSRFPGVGKKLKNFPFEQHYRAKIGAIIRGGRRIERNLESQILTEGDTLLLRADKSFARTWRESSAFHIVSYANDEDDEIIEQNNGQKWLGVSLLVFMIAAAALGDQFGGLDIFPVAAVIMVVMAVAKLFPAKRYTKYITWDVLVAIAAAFAISKAMSNSGINVYIADFIIDVTSGMGNYGVLALLYIVTMLLTEFITNNAAVAITFPVAVAIGGQLGINPMPLFVGICIAASASFSSPIGYQTNLIVQGVGGYKFRDYLRVGFCLNIITLIISVTLIPRIWAF